ncbi:PAQR family membrane homeostasis protein TrhA [Pedobacter flavus]|uniref:Hemolysin III family protein n=1 Tax=Pedobacter flavus TaxID=3113906 RepID=A0ABU7GZR8_9SPHI|nr:hemolysin III family protein [Pedobacter sp. VNH31]MEE1884578.1 hemolysin III family protein [Pedobacter sp. VNH31]
MLAVKSLREPVNFITHFIPALLSIPGGYYLFTLSGTPFEFTACIIYTLCMLSMFGVSAIYHGFPTTEYGIRFWQKFDHCCIYLMIAGTYTPTALLIFDGWLRWALVSLVWVIATVGCFLKINNKLKSTGLSVLIYILMGCLILPLIQKMLTVLPLEAVLWLIAGGVFYIWGTWYYAKDRPLSKFLHSHELWHFFVIFGALSHYIYTAYIFQAV